MKASESKTSEAEATLAGELDQPIWSVISFERREAAGLTHDQAARRMAELESRNVPGLCIVSNEAAARVRSA